MHYLRRYSIYFYDQTLRNQLESLGADCSLSDPQWPPHLCVDIDESKTGSAEAIALVTPLMSAEGNNGGRIATMTCWPEYTQDEYDNAEWLSMQSLTNKGVPVDDIDYFTKKCKIGTTKKGRDVHFHLVQTSPVVLKSHIKWGNTQFFCHILNSSDLFCSARAKALLEKSDLKGICFNPVYLGKKMTLLDTVFQLSAQDKLPGEAIVPFRDMCEKKCPICGQRKIKPTDDGHFRECRGRAADFPQDTDFCWTDVFDWECDFFISQKMYRFLKANKMLRGLWLEPVFPLV